MISQIYESWIRVRGWLIGVISLIIGVLAYYKLEDWSVWGKVLFPIVVLLALFVAVLIDSLYCLSKKRVLPRIVRVLAASAPFDQHSCILVTEPNVIFNHGSFVTVFNKDNECEVMIAHGTILNKQENGYLQIGVTFLGDTDTKLTERIKANDAAVLSSLLIKPTISKAILEAANVIH